MPCPVPCDLHQLYVCSPRGSALSGGDCVGTLSRQCYLEEAEAAGSLELPCSEP